MDGSQSTLRRDDGGEQEGKETEEYVLIDLDGVSGQVSIPPNAPYVLSGLDTLNPILIIDDKIMLRKLVVKMSQRHGIHHWFKPVTLPKFLSDEIGEYEETIGTCLVFSETDGTVVVHEETGVSEANLISERCIIDTNRSLAKDVKPTASLHKILKFRLMTDTDSNDSTDKQANSMHD